MAQYPKTAVIFARYGTVTVGNAYTLLHNAAQDFAHRAIQVPPADGDSFTHPFYLAAGSYTMKVMGYEGVGRGRIDWYIDGVKVISLQDWYAAVDANNIIKSASVTVVGNGRHTLTCIVNGKNGASAEYYIDLTTIALV